MKWRANSISWIGLPSQASERSHGDVTTMSELLTREEYLIYGDASYLGAKKREVATLKNKQIAALHVRFTLTDLQRAIFMY